MIRRWWGVLQGELSEVSGRVCTRTSALTTAALDSAMCFSASFVALALIPVTRTTILNVLRAGD